MEEEDDDVIFDRAGLLSSNIIKPAPQTQEHKLRVYCTICLCAAFFGLGLCIAIPGPTLLDLQQSTNADTSEISRIFTGRSIGYLVGSIIGGFLFDHFNQSCLLSFSLLLSALGTAAAPWCTSYVFLMGILAFQGVSMGFLDTGGNVLCLNTWGRQSAPYMQTLHFSFGLGAFVAPLVAEPFLSNTTFNETLIELEHANEKQADTKSASQRKLLSVILTDLDVDDMKVEGDIVLRAKREDTADINVDGEETGSKNNMTEPKTPKNKKPKSTDLSNIPLSAHAPDKKNKPNDTKQDDKDSIDNKTKGKESTKPPPMITKSVPKTTSTTPKSPPDDTGNVTKATGETKSTEEKMRDIAKKILDLKNLSKVEFAYLTIAVFNFAVSLMFLVLCCCGEKSLKAIRNQDIQPEYIVRKENKGFRVQILIMLFVFYFLYVGMEVTYGAFLMAFCVDYLKWDKTKGVLMTSVFWGSFAVGRGLAIPLAKCLNPPIMLIADLILCCLSLTGLLMGLDSNDTILWFCTAVLGLGLSSVFPTGITWAERYMHVTGKATAVFVVGSALGEMAMPALVGWLFEVKNPMWLIKILLGCALLSVVLYIFMQNLASNMGDRYQRLPRISLHEGMDMEMDSLPISNQTEVFNSEDSWTPHRSESAKKVTFNLQGSSANTHSTKKGSILKTKSQAKQD